MSITVSVPLPPYLPNGVTCSNSWSHFPTWLAIPFPSSVVKLPKYYCITTIYASWTCCDISLLLLGSPAVREHLVLWMCLFSGWCWRTQVLFPVGGWRTTWSRSCSGDVKHQKQMRYWQLSLWTQGLTPVLPTLTFCSFHAGVAYDTFHSRKWEPPHRGPDFVPTRGCCSTCLAQDWPFHTRLLLRLLTSHHPESTR